MEKTGDEDGKILIFFHFSLPKFSHCSQEVTNSPPTYITVQNVSLSHFSITQYVKHFKFFFVSNQKYYL